MIIKNKTDSILEFNNLGFSLLANEEKDISQIVEDCKHDNTFLHYIGSSRLSIINGTIELFTSEALNFLYTQNDNLKDLSGKLLIHETSKKPEHSTYWTGGGDNTNIYNACSVPLKSWE